MSTFTPVTKVVPRPKESLLLFAKEHKIAPESIDFDLIDCHTYYQAPKIKEWILLEEPLESAFEEKLIRSELLKLRQSYEIRIRPVASDSTLLHCAIALAANPSKSKITAIIKAGSIIPASSGALELLKNEIQKKKLRAGLMIALFEPYLDEELQEMLQKYAAQTLSKDIRINAGESPAPIAQEDDHIIYHYDKKERNENRFLDGVEAGDLIAEYVKPKKGKHGRNCAGAFIEVPDPKTKYEGYLAPDVDTVERHEDEKSVTFFAKRSGYVKNERGVLKISTEVSLESASFRQTGAIDPGQEKEITVNIKNRKSELDAVGSGVNIDVKELNVEGTIGANTTIKASELNVGEQTHRSAKLEAMEHAVIKLHRGTLKAKTAEIDILETGSVNADDVSVNKMLGGEITAQRVVIKELISNATVTASESIEVHHIFGEDNTLIIDPHCIASYHERIDALQKDIKAKESTYETLTQTHTTQSEAHRARAPRIRSFQKKVLAATQAGKPPLKADVARIKQYKQEALKLEEEGKQITQNTQELQSMREELHKLYEADLHAKIMMKSDYNGHTKIIFVDPKTEQQYMMTPEGSRPVIYLKQEGDKKVIAWDFLL